MKYTSFTIKNFKGIKNTTLGLHEIAGASVFALVGLNESGKTTILEAIHSFAPDEATSELLGGTGGSGVPFKERVPRHLLSTFTGEISVLATLTATDSDRDMILRTAKEKLNIAIDPASLPNELVLERHQSFVDGDFKASYFTMRNSLRVKSGKQKNWRSPDNDERVKLRDIVYGLTPDIAYFPTFVFQFPDRIFLTYRDNPVQSFYRRTFQDILDFDGQGHTIEKDIIRRLHDERLQGPWIKFISLWAAHDDRTKIQHVMDRAGSAVTKLVFGRWNTIFGEDTRGKEIIISFETLEGEDTDSRGAKTPSEKHDIYVRFQIRDGTRRFKVNDRSLGFRWFFAFMLFTQFRVARTRTRPLLFLFDEPASNLHAAAQQKLIDSFPEIAKGDHSLIYTTHSHYMIEPKWLEQTCIVTNRADAPPSDSVLDAVSLDDESLDIQASSYRSFVNAHPTQTSYFQPILDRLNVVPSRFDINKSSIVVEGKSDYYIIRYAMVLVGNTKLNLLPGLGAGTFGALVALHVGWNLKFLFVLDGDHQGRIEQKRYVVEYGVPEDRIITLTDLIGDAYTIEDIFDSECISAIQSQLNIRSRPSKNQIMRFCQERLSQGDVRPLSEKFYSTATKLIEELEARVT